MTRGDLVRNKYEDTYPTHPEYPWESNHPGHCILTLKAGLILEVIKYDPIYLGYVDCWIPTLNCYISNASTDRFEIIK